MQGARDVSAHMRTRATRVAATAGALVLLLVTPAAAQRSEAPPGNAGVDQYLESVPSSGGDRPSKGNPAHAGASDSSAAATGAADNDTGAAASSSGSGAADADSGSGSGAGSRSAA